MAAAWTAVLVWGLAGVGGGQICALLVLDRRAHPGVNMVLLAVLRRAPRLLATASLLVVVIGAAGLAGLAVAAGLIYLPQLVLPAFGVSTGTARTLSLLITLPMLVAGLAPALWALARYALALPLSAIAETSPFAILSLSRRLSRGHGVSIVGLLVVTLLANSVLVLLSRAGGLARDAAVLARAVPADLRGRAARRGVDRRGGVDPARRDHLRQRAHGAAGPAPAGGAGGGADPRGAARRRPLSPEKQSPDGRSDHPAMKTLGVETTAAPGRRCGSSCGT